MRGFFKMDYTGATGQGTGAIAFADGKVAGLDVGGGVYVGTYQEIGDKVAGSVDLSFPAGGLMVTGAVVPPGSPPMNIPFEADAGNEAGVVLTVTTPVGPVNIRLTKISQL
jgi:hypothetical protein